MRKQLYVIRNNSGVNVSNILKPEPDAELSNTPGKAYTDYAIALQALDYGVQNYPSEASRVDGWTLVALAMPEAVMARFTVVPTTVVKKEFPPA